MIDAGMEKDGQPYRALRREREPVQEARHEIILSNGHQVLGRELKGRMLRVWMQVATVPVLWMDSLRDRALCFLYLMGSMHLVEWHHGDESTKNEV